MFVFLLCLAEILSMVGTMYFPALLPSFREEWGISNTAAGWINGTFFAGYALSSPLLVGLTDRVDPRRIYLPSALLAAVSMLVFGMVAEGTWTAGALRLLAGIGLAGTYMPGLRALSDHISGPRQSRSIVFYTASYGIGTALSVFLAGLLGPYAGWRLGAELIAIGPLCAFFIFAVVVPKSKMGLPQGAPAMPLQELSRVLRNRTILGYIIGYGAHCWELFGFRSWLVAFLAFSFHLHALQDPLFSPQNIAMIILLMGVPATILGNEGAMRWNRSRMIWISMFGAGGIGCISGFSVGLHPALVASLAMIYGMAVMMDSGALTAGIVNESDVRRRGLTLAVYSFTGFSMAFLAPLCFGAVLDIAPQSPWGWGLAFCLLGTVCMATSVVLKTFFFRT